MSVARYELRGTGCGLEGQFVISDLWERLLAAIDAVDRIGIKLIRIKKTRNPYASVQSIQSAIRNPKSKHPHPATRN